jgi:Ca2+-binding EF-hand superfamily protein
MSIQIEVFRSFLINLYTFLHDLHSTFDYIILSLCIHLFFRFQPPFTRRQLAEIQLTGIIKDPELSLAHLVNDKTKFELDDLATRLCTQTWLVKRLLHTLDVEDTDSLSVRDVHTLTRVLTGSFDARLLLLFNVIDVDRDQRVTGEELIQFFSQYLDGVTSFKTINIEEGKDRRETILTILLTKFHLHQLSHIDFDQFYELVLNDATLIEALSKFTVHPSW